ncbi:MAG: AAA family ATPase [Magnetococcales bacterium]|nr:AAA family ATPase [Magnetococcales bacterium]
MMDFNQSGPQTNAGLSSEARHNVERLKECMQGRMESVLSYLLPAGKVRSGKFYVGDVQGNPGDSMEVELTGPKAGMWFDHATGQGSDIIELWAVVRHLDTRRDFPKILDEIANWLGEAPQAMRPKPNRKSPPTDDLGPYTGKWDYFNKDGQLICCMYRYDLPNGKKTYRPYDVKTGKKQDPEGFWPLYHQPKMAGIRDIVFVEGEKCADALLSVGIVAATSMHGAKAPVKKTDWSPLVGKNLLIWPDKDKVGWDYAVNVAHAALQAGALSVAILVPPGDKPKKWDAADAVAEGMNIHEFMANAERQVMQHAFSASVTTLATALPAPRFDLLDWTFDRFLGPPPERKWLVRGVLPLAVPGMVAAIGGAGKSMLLMDLVVKTASVVPGMSMPPRAMGGQLEPEVGTAVMLTAEDDQAEVHRRLHGLSPQLNNHARLIVLPLPNVGGAMPLVSAGRDGPVLTEEFDRLRNSLSVIRDLRLLVFDPLQSFTGADVNADPAAGTLFFAALGRLAAETGATVLSTHHFRKAGRSPIVTAQDARESIRGTTALVDSGRWSYALWSVEENEAEKICQNMNIRFKRDSVFRGAVVKSNWPTDKTVRVYVRDPSTGLLMDRTTDLHVMTTPEHELADLLVNAIKQASENGRPFTHTGGPGVFRQRNRLPAVFHNISRTRIEALVQQLMNERPPRLVKGMATGSHEPKWLDVPNGLFANGCGEFVHGADNVER